MPKKILLVLSIAAVGVVVACGKSDLPVSPTSAGSGGDALADGSTLKINAPTPIAPTNGVQISRGAPFVVTFTNVQGRYATFPVTYELEIRNAATGAVVANNKFPAQSGANTSFTVPTELTAFDTIHNWRVRATYQRDAQQGLGPWSATASFKSPLRAFLNQQTGAVFDPLTEGFTVGQQHGGRFIQGQGWEAQTNEDGIDYDIPTCSNCRVEFDVTNFGDGLGNKHDDKWISMGERDAFGGFDVFRNHPWKMHLEQRADGDGTGMKLIWRNGCGDCFDGEPGDHTGKLPSGPDWQENQVYHFALDWNRGGFTITVNGEVWFADTFRASGYEPPGHRISIGCYPRGETLRAIYRNFTVTPR
jgi:hypothetical protein